MKRAPRVSPDDLRLAAEWCDDYENAGDADADETAKIVHRVAEWLRIVAAQREETSAVRKVARGAKVSSTVVRRKLREQAAR